MGPKWLEVDLLACLPPNPAASRVAVLDHKPKPPLARKEANISAVGTVKITPLEK